jgi:hypothetical protein
VRAKVHRADYFSASRHDCLAILSVAGVIHHADFAQCPAACAFRQSQQSVLLANHGVERALDAFCRFALPLEHLLAGFASLFTL